MKPENDDDHSEQSEPQSKLRVTFQLLPGHDGHDGVSLAVPTEDLAVPASLRKSGLSAVVNHLLDRSVDDDGRLPPIPFDFLLDATQTLLRLPLDAAVRKEGISTERAIKLFYFPARPPPKKEAAGPLVPDWITAMDYCGTPTEAVLFAGGADGVVRTVNSAGQLGTSLPAHSGSIHSLHAMDISEVVDHSVLVATGSMDQTLLTHLYKFEDYTSNNGSTLNHHSWTRHALYSGGHFNSITSVALSGTSMASGDWDGGLALWTIPSLDNNSSQMDDSGNNHKRHRGNRTTSSNFDTSTHLSTHEVRPQATIKAHSANISGIAWGYASSSSSPATTLITSSWDHGLKVYDVTRMDCVLSLNGSRAITCLSRCSNSDIVATGCPDWRVRLWDMRTNTNGSGTGGGSVSHMKDSTLTQSHKAWVSNVRWSPTDPYVLASTSHDGTLKVWDIRSSVPLHTVKAVSKKDAKALCLAFGQGCIYTGGSDCVINRFASAVKS